MTDWELIILILGLLTLLCVSVLSVLTLWVISRESKRWADLVADHVAIPRVTNLNYNIFSLSGCHEWLCSHFGYSIIGFSKRTNSEALNTQ